MPKKRFAADINNWRIRHTLKSFGVKLQTSSLSPLVCVAICPRTSKPHLSLPILRIAIHSVCAS